MNNLDSLVVSLKETLSLDKNFLMPVKGTSMLPFINDKMKVVLEKPNNLKKNDIIFYQRTDGQYVLHRIYKIKNDAFVLLGDNQVNKEYPIYQSQVLAKVKRIKVDENKYKNLSGFKYNIYLLFWNRLLLRRVILKLRRIFHAK